jgi:hypothetical protein
LEISSIEGRTGWDFQPTMLFLKTLIRFSYRQFFNRMTNNYRLKFIRDESMSCLSEVEGLKRKDLDDGDIYFGYKMNPHKAVASSSFSGSSDNEGIPCSDIPCSTQPGGKFISAHSFHLQVS